MPHYMALWIAIVLLRLGLDWSISRSSFRLKLLQAFLVGGASMLILYALGLPIK